MPEMGLLTRLQGTGLPMGDDGFLNISLEKAVGETTSRGEHILVPGGVLTRMVPLTMIS